MVAFCLIWGWPNVVSATSGVEKVYTNSVGMKLVRIEPGVFRMGQLKTPLPPEVLPVFRGRGLFDALNQGDYDEKPVHSVKISKPFYIGVFEVTNFQYELFEPQHKKLRGKNGFSKDNDEAVVFVSKRNGNMPVVRERQLITTQVTCRRSLFWAKGAGRSSLT